MGPHINGLNSLNHVFKLRPKILLVLQDDSKGVATQVTGKQKDASHTADIYKAVT